MLHSTASYFVGISVVLATLSPVALSADALEEIIVMAQKREQNLQQVPVSVTVFDQGDQQRLQAHTLSDLQYATPGLYISPGRRSLTEIGLRGISDQTRNAGYDSRISVYLDDVFMGRSSGIVNLPVVDIEQVEVLHGPQGTLFGKNTVAGAINIRTRQPDAEPFVELGVDTGSDNYRALSARVNGALVDEALLGKLVLQQRDRDGVIDNLYQAGDDELNGLDEELLRGQLKWVASDQLDIRFDMDYSSSQGPYVNSEALADDTPYQVNINADVDSTVKQKGAALQVDYQLDGQRQISLLTGLRESVNHLVYDEDFSTADVAISDLNTRDRHHSQEFRLTSTTDKLTYVVGLYWLTQENVANNAAVVGDDGPLSGLSPNTRVDYDAEVNVTNQAVFTHLTYAFHEQWEVVAGLRYDYEKKKLDFDIVNSITAGGNDLFETGQVIDHRSRNSWSPKLGVNYHINNQHMLYASYSRAFKSGGWNTDYVATLNGLSFDDERVDSIELGTKSSYLDGSLLFDMAAYYSRYDAFQVFQFESDGSTSSMRVTNAAETYSQGVEASLQWRMTDTFRSWMSYAWNETRFESFKEGDSLHTDFSGNTAPYAPANTVSLSVEHEYPLRGNLSLISQADYQYRDSFYTHSNNLDDNRVDGYGLYNARLGIQAADERWSAFFWVKNLTDVEEIQDKSISFLQVPRASYTEPRSLGLAFRYQWK